MLLKSQKLPNIQIYLIYRNDMLIRKLESVFRIIFLLEDFKIFIFGEFLDNMISIIKLKLYDVKIMKISSFEASFKTLQ